MLAAVAIWILATAGLAVEVVIFILPWSLGLVERIDPIVARTYFWWFGHPLTYFWLVPAYVLWYTVIPRGGRQALQRRRHPRGLRPVHPVLHAGGVPPPVEYVRESTGLGYATTIHSAQGVSADTMHGLATGQESRQQLYTMLTRGRLANHLYLQVVGDGDPHTVIRPETVAPPTPTETLQQILARDEAPVSATTLLRERSDPAARLFDAVQRYTDGLHAAAEQLLGAQIVDMLDVRADQVVPHLTDEPSWPTLRAHLLTLAADTGEHPLLHLLTAAAGRELHTAADMAAVLDWRLPEPAPTDPGPLPWLPGVPEALHDHPVWGQYLAKRSQLVTDLANRIRGHASQDDTQPVWAPPGSRPNVAIIGEVAVWRAANGIHPSDPRPTGGTQLETAPAIWKQGLDRDIARDTYHSADTSGAEPGEGRSALSRYGDRQPSYLKPARRPSGPSAPGR